MRAKHAILAILLAVLLWLALRKGKHDRETRQNTLFSKLYSLLFGEPIILEVQPEAVAPGAPSTPPLPETGRPSATDYSALAEAIRELARGVQVPAIYTASRVFTGADERELVAAESGVSIYPLSYAITAGTGVTVEFYSGARRALLWRIHLEPVAGRSGANLCGSWPLPVFTPTNPGEALYVVVDAACEVTVSYWRQ